LFAEGSLLWAFHDLAVSVPGGFQSKIDEYRAFLIQQQDLAGSWDVDDLQITAYAMVGLEAVGSADTAVQNAAVYLLAKQQPAGGWNLWVGGPENTEVDAEIVRALVN